MQEDEEKFYASALLTLQLFEIFLTVTSVMDDLPYLTDHMIKILQKELKLLLKSQVFTSQSHLNENIERFASYCLQDTHPQMFEQHVLIEDKELKNYIDDLRYFSLNGGFNETFEQFQDDQNNNYIHLSGSGTSSSGSS